MQMSYQGKQQPLQCCLVHVTQQVGCCAHQRPITAAANESRACSGHLLTTQDHTVEVTHHGHSRCQSWQDCWSPALPGGLSKRPPQSQTEQHQSQWMPACLQRKRKSQGSVLKKLHPATTMRSAAYRQQWLESIKPFSINLPRGSCRQMGQPAMQHGQPAGAQGTKWREALFTVVPKKLATTCTMSGRQSGSHQRLAPDL